MLLLLAFLGLVAGDLARLLKHPNEKTFDRDVDGVAERQYLIVFNQMAPNFGDKQTLQVWAANNGVQSDNVKFYYSIRKFQGFAAWLSEKALFAMLEQSIVDYVEEDVEVNLDFTREPLLKAVTQVPVNPTWQARVDWGQQRVSSRGWNLQTTNTSTGASVTLYRNFTSGLTPIYAFPYPGAANGQWDWTTRHPQLPSTGSQAVVWVVDTGIRINHVEFEDGRGGTRVENQTNFVDTPGDTGLDDLNGHGTHCAGTAAGNYRGVAPGARLRSVRVLGANGSGSWAGVIAGFNHVANNQVPAFANIMSISLGGGATETVDHALNQAVSAGVIAVVAAGNSNNNACGVSGIGGNSPARAAQAITVVASASDDSVATFSSWGPCCKSVAPGVTITSAWIAPSGSTANNYYNDISGTSMATPHVAGAIAVHVSTPGIPQDPDSVKADLALDQTRGVVQGLTGNKESTPNLLLYSLWKQN